MKVTKLRVRKKVRIASIKRLKKDVDEVVYDCLMDIKSYLVNDVMMLLKKRGIIYAKKPKKN